MGLRVPAFRSSAVSLTIALSALLAGGSSPAVAAPTYDQVLAAPDDPQINLDYAREEANQGNLLNAAAALERILLAHPNAHGVRLFYAVVLYRLNDLQGAKQQLKELENVRLTPLQAAERNKYEDLVERGQSAFSITGKISAGVAAESDAIGALLNQLDFPGAHSPKNGVAAATSGDIEVSHDLGPSSDYSLFGGASIYSRASFAGPNADFLFAEARLGVRSSVGLYSWELAPVFRHYLIFDVPYLTEYGGQQQFNWHQTPSITWTESIEVVDQTYHEPFVDFLVPFFIPGTHDGTRYDASLGLSFRVDSYSTISATVGYEGKSAGNPPFSYDSEFLQANYHALLGEGAYFDFQGDLRYANYRQRDNFFLFGRKRQDLRSDVRAALGAPLSVFDEAGATGDFRENLILEGAVSFADRTTRFPLAPFHSLGGELRLIWKFGGGV
jgi:hypothetical protein